jgi:hypothetical protein
LETSTSSVDSAGGGSNSVTDALLRTDDIEGGSRLIVPPVSYRRGEASVLGEAEVVLRQGDGGAELCILDSATVYATPDDAIAAFDVPVATSNGAIQIETDSAAPQIGDETHASSVTVDAGSLCPDGNPGAGTLCAFGGDAS